MRKALEPQGFLVNIGRSSLLDTDALAAALRESGIAGAGLGRPWCLPIACKPRK